jgi:hypothetical protein
VGIVAHRGGELGGDEHLAAQGLAKRLHARNLVDHWPDHGEVKTIDRTDIAIEHLSKRTHGLAKGKAGHRLSGTYASPSAWKGWESATMSLEPAYVLR